MQLNTEYHAFAVEIIVHHPLMKFKTVHCHALTQLNAALMQFNTAYHDHVLLQFDTA